MPGCRRQQPVRRGIDWPLCRRGRSVMTRLLLMLFLLALTAGGVVAYKDPEKAARASDTISDLLRKRTEPARTVEIPRGQSGEFAVLARINGVTTPMVVDTGATSVVLT